MVFPATDETMRLVHWLAIVEDVDTFRAGNGTVDDCKHTQTDTRREPLTHMPPQKFDVAHEPQTPTKMHIALMSESTCLSDGGEAGWHA